MRWISFAGLFCWLAGSAFAQLPLIFNRSVSNAASYMPAGIPGGAIARGSIFSLFGAHIGPAQPANPGSFPLQTSLGGVSINVIQAGTSVSAIPLYVSAGQINAIMPSNAPLGMASVQVVVNGNLKSNLHPVRIVNSAFGVFSVLGTGSGPGVFFNFLSADNQPVNSPTVTAQKGQVITLYGTGLGPVTGGDNVAPKAGNLPVQVDVFVGGVPAAVQYSGRTPCCAGLDQIVFTVPDKAPSGCWVPVYVRTGGTSVGNVTTMAIDPAAGVCSTDVLPHLSSALVNGQALGEVVAVRAATHQDVGVRAPVDVTADYHLSFGIGPKIVPFPFNPALSVPPSGTCTVYTAPGDILKADPLPGMMPAAMPLDFGAPLMLMGPRGAKTLTYIFSGARGGYLGGSITNGILPSSLFLDPGSYTVNGLGGPDVGAFSTTFNIPQPPVWTNRDQLTLVNRSQPLNISWTGGDAGQVVKIIGFGEDLPTNSSAVFACIAPPGATSFSVPPDILSNLPPTRANPLQSKDIVYLVTLAGSSLQNINAKGLDQASTGFYSINGKTVVLQ
jgi:uncharacterized protein (TIGR03437 family)